MVCTAALTQLLGISISKHNVADEKQAWCTFSLPTETHYLWPKTLGKKTTRTKIEHFCFLRWYWSFFHHAGILLFFPKSTFLDQDYMLRVRLKSTFLLLDFLCQKLLLTSGVLLVEGLCSLPPPLGALCGFCPSASDHTLLHFAKLLSVCTANEGTTHRLKG